MSGLALLLAMRVGVGASLGGCPSGTGGDAAFVRGLVDPPSILVARGVPVGQHGGTLKRSSGPLEHLRTARGPLIAVGHHRIAYPAISAGSNRTGGNGSLKEPLPARAG